MGYHHMCCGRKPLSEDELYALARAIRTANVESSDAYFERIREDSWSRPPEFPRAWHFREQQRYTLHPSVIGACAITRPHDWHQLVLEWPHCAHEGTDRSRLAYTQDDAKGVADRQTVTSIGKYLTRHWKGLLADETIRDLSAKHTAQGMFISRKAEDIVRAAREGPYSCMQWDEDTVVKRGGHPYEVYDPQYGWGMCMHIQGEVIVGRALVYENGGHKRFVRTYGSGRGSDNEMEVWLRDQGYSHQNCWPQGAKLAKVKASGYHDRPYILPYLDGGVTYVSDEGDCFKISDYGEYECQNQDGTYGETGEECEDCGSRQQADNMTWIGRHGDRHVCEDCAEDYTCCYGRNGEQYYLDNDSVVEVGGEYYDINYLEDNDIVRLGGDGEYAHKDDCTVCGISDEWYLSEDCVYVEDREEDVHRDEAWQCAETGNYYSDEEESVEIDGEQYHPTSLKAQGQKELFT